MDIIFGFTLSLHKRVGGCMSWHGRTARGMHKERITFIFQTVHVTFSYIFMSEFVFELLQGFPRMRISMCALNLWPDKIQPWDAASEMDQAIWIRAAAVPAL